MQYLFIVLSNVFDNISWNIAKKKDKNSVYLQYINKNLRQIKFFIYVELMHVYYKRDAE